MNDALTPAEVALKTCYSRGVVSGDGPVSGIEVGCLPYSR